PKYCEGPSIKKLLENPKPAWDRPAVTTHGYQKHAVRTEKYRYMRYADGSEELYDEVTDPREWKNLAADSNYAAVKKELAQWMPKTNVPTPGAAEKAAERTDAQKAERKAKRAAANK